MVYKYNPEDFRELLCMEAELGNFYKHLSIYRNKKTRENWYVFKRHWEDVFFTLKARVVEGGIDPVTAQEIRDYMEELVND